MKPIRFEIDTPPGSWMNNRNGTPDITKILISYFSTSGVWVRAVGTSGRVLRGGMLIASGEAMDELCRTWLSQRGKLLDDRV